MRTQDLTEALRLAKMATPVCFRRASFAPHTFYRGVSRVQEGKWAGAKDDLRLAVGWYPKSWLAWDSLGYARAHSAITEGAIPDYNRGLSSMQTTQSTKQSRLGILSHGPAPIGGVGLHESDPPSPRWGLPYQNRGQVYFAAADYRDADSDFSRAIKLIPKAWSWGYRCETRENLGRGSSDALYDCNRALAYYPTWSNVYVDRAWAKATLGANKSALADANNAVKTRSP